MRNRVVRAFREKFGAEDRIRDVLKAFGLPPKYTIGEWSKDTTCPVCRGHRFGVMVNKNLTIGLSCRDNFCPTESIMRAADLSDADLTGKGYRKIKPTKNAKALVVPGHHKTACISNPFAGGGRFKNRRQPPPAPNVLKIFMLLAAQVHARKDEAFNTFVTTPRELWHLLGYRTPPTYEELKVFIVSCLAFVTGVERDGVFSGVRWFADDMRADAREGKVYLRLHDACRPHLLQLTKDYAKIRPSSVFRMQRTYAILLYMVLCRYTGSGWWKDEHFVLVDDLLRALMVPALSKTARNFWLFEANVLRRAKTEIESCTELRFSYSVVRTAGKARGDVVGVRFFNIDTVEISEVTGRRNIDRIELRRRVEDAEREPEVNRLDVHDPYAP